MSIECNAYNNWWYEIYFQLSWLYVSYNLCTSRYLVYEWIKLFICTYFDLVNYFSLLMLILWLFSKCWNSFCFYLFCVHRWLWCVNIILFHRKSTLILLINLWSPTRWGNFFGVQHMFIICVYFYVNICEINYLSIYLSIIILRKER